jgi:hypothetical protein
MGPSLFEDPEHNSMGGKPNSGVRLMMEIPQKMREDQRLMFQDDIRGVRPY